MASIRFVLLSIFTATVVQSAPFWDAVDPEQVLFIATRCMEDWGPKARDPKKSLENWKNWKLEPADDRATQCYTKCVLEKIGFYDSAERRFKGVHLVQQWETYHKYLKADRVKVLDLGGTFDMIKPMQGNPDCSTVFSAYINVHNRFLDTIKAILFGDGTSAEKYYNEKGDQIKKKGQSLFVFCENIHYPVGSAKRKQELCKIRKYDMGSGEEFSAHMACIFKGLRYLNKKNELDVDEIVRDFRLVKKNTDAVEANLKKCKGSLKETDPGAIAVYYYKCLLNDPNVVNDFKEAFDYREIRSQNYLSLATSMHYNKNEVREKVNNIDNEHCS